jgi:hypothetical protein
MAKQHDRGRRDEAGVGPYARSGVRLVPLAELGDWDVASGEPDIRGWEVRTLSGRVIGEVDDLLIDADQGEAVMIDIDIKGSDRHTLAPIRAAQVDRVERCIRIDTSDLSHEDMPTIARADVSDEDARSFSERYGRAYGEKGFAPERDYVVEGRDHDLHFTRREEQKAREDRESRDAGEATAGAPEEERVIERRPVVVEEVVVRRRVVKDDDENARVAQDRKPDLEEPERRA